MGGDGVYENQNCIILDPGRSVEKNSKFVWEPDFLLFLGWPCCTPEIIGINGILFKLVG